MKYETKNAVYNWMFNLAIVAIWAYVMLAVFGCDGTPPPTGIAKPVPHAYKCEVARQAAYNHLIRCNGEVDNVCIPAQLLEPCTTAVHVNEESYDRCMNFLTETTSCSYVAFSCDWTDIFTFAPTKSADMPLDTPVQKCEALAQRTRERGVRQSSKPGAVVCVDPERMLPCSRAVDVSDDYDNCMLRLVTATGGEKACKTRGLVTIAPEGASGPEVTW